MAIGKVNCFAGVGVGAGVGAGVEVVVELMDIL